MASSEQFNFDGFPSTELEVATLPPGDVKKIDKITRLHLGIVSRRGKLGRRRGYLTGEHDEPQLNKVLGHLRACCWTVLSSLFIKKCFDWSCPKTLLLDISVNILGNVFTSQTGASGAPFLAQWTALGAAWLSAHFIFRELTEPSMQGASRACSILAEPGEPCPWVKFPRKKTHRHFGACFYWGKQESGWEM